jgi:hypothetical protein
MAAFDMSENIETKSTLGLTPALSAVFYLSTVRYLAAMFCFSTVS